MQDRKRRDDNHHERRRPDDSPDVRFHLLPPDIRRDGERTHVEREVEEAKDERRKDVLKDERFEARGFRGGRDVGGEVEGCGVVRFFAVERSPGSRPSRSLQSEEGSAAAPDQLLQTRRRTCVWLIENTVGGTRCVPILIPRLRWYSPFSSSLSLLFLPALTLRRSSPSSPSFSLPFSPASPSPCSPAFT